MLATRISFMNEIANLCERVGADVDLVRRGIGSDSRIGSSFLFPGPGYGGSCFPKDVQALLRTSREMEITLDVVAGAETANERQKVRLFQKVQALTGNVHGKRIAVWGLAFKPNTDDMREAPSLTLIHQLLEAGATIAVHDPVAIAEARRILGDRVSYEGAMYDALIGADALVLVTEWNAYRNPDFERIKRTLAHPVVVDGRNLYDGERLRSMGFTYDAIGKGRRSVTA
jgi:UDPglucose 6-dehydrogenase